MNKKLFKKFSTDFGESRCLKINRLLFCSLLQVLAIVTDISFVCAKYSDIITIYNSRVTSDEKLCTFLIIF